MINDNIEYYDMNIEILDDIKNCFYDIENAYNKIKNKNRCLTFGNDLLKKQLDNIQFTDKKETEEDKNSFWSFYKSKKSKSVKNKRTSENFKKSDSIMSDSFSIVFMNNNNNNLFSLKNINYKENDSVLNELKSIEEKIKNNIPYEDLKDKMKTILSKIVEKDNNNYRDSFIFKVSKIKNTEDMKNKLNKKIKKATFNLLKILFNLLNFDKINDNLSAKLYDFKVNEAILIDKIDKLEKEKNDVQNILNISKMRLKDFKSKIKINMNKESFLKFKISHWKEENKETIDMLNLLDEIYNRQAEPEDLFKKYDLTNNNKISEFLTFISKIFEKILNKYDLKDKVDDKIVSICNILSKENDNNSINSIIDMLDNKKLDFFTIKDWEFWLKECYNIVGYTMKTSKNVSKLVTKFSSNNSNFNKEKISKIIKEYYNDTISHHQELQMNFTLQKVIKNKSIENLKQIVSDLRDKIKIEISSQDSLINSINLLI